MLQQNRSWQRCDKNIGIQSLGNSLHFVLTHKHRTGAAPVHCFVHQHGIRTNKSKTNENFANFLTPIGFCFCTTCSWPIASSCTFAIRFLQTFFVAKQVWGSLVWKICIRIHKHRHVNYSTIVWVFLLWNRKLNVPIVHILEACQ